MLMQICILLFMALRLPLAFNASCNVLLVRVIFNHQKCTNTTFTRHSLWHKQNNTSCVRLLLKYSWKSLLPNVIILPAKYFVTTCAMQITFLWNWGLSFYESNWNLISFAYPRSTIYLWKSSFNIEWYLDSK